jgi:hypothetical protein
MEEAGGDKRASLNSILITSAKRFIVQASAKMVEFG